MSPGEIRGDALKELPTTDSALSVYLVEDYQHAKRVLVAVTAGSARVPDRVDFALAEKTALEDWRFEFAEVAGKTPDRKVNEQHRDLVYLSGSRLVDLARLWIMHSCRYRISKREYVETLKECDRKGYLDRGRLSESMLEALSS